MNDRATTAIELALSLTTLAGHLLAATTELQQAMARAQAEGRELSPDELAAYRSERVIERARWKAQLPGG